MSKILFQRIVSLHAAASELAETIRLERLVDTGLAESRSLGARGAYRAVERRLLTLSRFFSLGRGEVSDESQGALPGLWEYGKYYPAPEASLGPGELDDIVAGVSRLFEAQNSLFEVGFAKGYQSGQTVPASIGRSVMHNLERGIELLARFCPQPAEEPPAPPASTETEGHPKTDNTENGSELSREAQAILFIQERIKSTGRLPTKKAIALALDVDRRTLNNWKAFKVAYKRFQATQKRPPPPRGSKRRRRQRRSMAARVKFPTRISQYLP